MYIESVSLTGYVGILEGTGRQQLNVDFTPMINAGVKRACFFGRNGSGKAQPTTSTVFDRTGPKPLGSVKVGDEVLDEHGQPAIVDGVFPQGLKEVWEVEFNDGTITPVCKDHLFRTLQISYRKPTKERYFREKTHSVEEILRSGLYAGNTHKYYIPMLSAPASFSPRDVSIHPYVLGALLGDGGLTTNAVKFSNSEEDVVARFARLLPDTCKLKRITDTHSTHSPSYSVQHSDSVVQTRYLKVALRTSLEALGLMGHGSLSKFIPDDYKFNTPEVRLEVLRGLFDTDGCVEDGFALHYYTSCDQLAADVVFLVESLGGVARARAKKVVEVRNGEKIQHKDGHAVAIKLPPGMLPFTSLKHSSRYVPPVKYNEPRRKICDVRPTGRFVEMVCISLASESKLYLTDNFVVTHNTTVVNSLTPFPSQCDPREFLIDGQAARKIIVFNRDGTRIKCDIRWNAKHQVAAFMYIGDSETPTTATSKGNLGEYIQAVEDELGVTKDYLLMGRVGSRVGSFLDLPPGKRKDFIGQFLPEVEEWAAMHRLVSKRVAAIKSRLSGQKAELERIEPRDVLEAEYARQQVLVNTQRDALQLTTAAEGAAKGALEVLRPRRSEILVKAGFPSSVPAFNPISSLVTAQEVQLVAQTNALNAMIAERPAIANFVLPEAAKAKLNDIRQALSALGGELTTLTSNRAAARGRYDVACRARDDAAARVKRAENSQNDLAKLETIIAAQEAEVVALTAVAAEHDLVGMDELSLQDVRAAQDLMGTLDGELAAIRSAFTTMDFMNMAGESQLDPDAFSRYIADWRGHVSNAQAQLSRQRQRREVVAAHATFFKSFHGMHCHNSKCPFETHLAQYATAAAELAEADASIEVATNRLADAELRVSQGQSALAGARAAKALHGQVRRHTAILTAAGVWDYFGPTQKFVAAVTGSSSLGEHALSVQRLMERVRTARGLKEATRVLGESTARRDSLVELAAAHESLVEARSASEIACADAQEVLNESVAALAACERRISGQNAAKALIEKLVGLQDQIQATNESIVRYTSLSNELEELRDQWDTHTTAERDEHLKRVAAETALRAAETASNAATFSLQRRDEFEASVAEVGVELVKAQTIADACNPAKGAPLEFLRDFLDVTRSGVNELLDVAFSGALRLDFILNEKEFRVPVSLGSGRTINDITEASEGQFALAKTVLSLALIRQTLAESAMNIVYLDEVDGPLDRERNKERFAEIVDRLAVELRLQQIFLISHNEAFFTAPAGLVLFPGHGMPVTEDSFMHDKIVLADLS